MLFLVTLVLRDCDDVVLPLSVLGNRVCTAPIFSLLGLPDFSAILKAEWVDGCVDV